MSWFSKAVKSCGKAVGKVTKVAVSPVLATGKLIGKVPIVGGALSASYDLTFNAPFKLAHNIADGKRIDKAVVGHFKDQLAAAKTVAPYAQTIVSFVPGVGQGVAGAIGAGLALAEGQPINEAMIAAVKGAIPGGVAAQAAFSVAASVAQGKPFDEVAISALPLSDQQKKALKAAAGMAKDIAAGKKIDDAVYKNTLKVLPTQVSAGVQTAAAVIKGKNLQDSVVKNMGPAILTTICKEGGVLASKNPVFRAGQNLLKAQPAVKNGFDVGVAVASKKIRPIDMVAIRKKLKGPQKKGFDMALATHIGMVTRPPANGKHSPESQLGYYITHGMRQAKPTHKVAMMKEIAKNPVARAGAVTAVKEVQWVDAPWWKKLLADLGIKVGPAV